MTETSTPAATPDGADPSMEDILASIRRILNEEETPAGSETPHEAPVDDDVLVLDETMMVPAAVGATAAEAEAEAEAEDAVQPQEPDADMPAPRVEPPRQQEVVVAPVSVDLAGLPAPTPDLMAPETAAAAASSVSSLMRTLAAGRATQVYSGGPTLEDIVRAELRPLLKDWLDTNLPPLVERLVRAEIERVVGRAVP